MKNKKGFTLVEIIVVMAILTIIVGGVTSIFYPGFLMFGKENDITAAKDLANQTISVLKTEIRSANNYIGTQCPENIEENEYEKSLITIDSSGQLLIDGSLPNALPTAAYKGYQLSTNFSQAKDSAGDLASIVKIDVSVLSKTSNRIIYEVSVLVSSINPDVAFKLSTSKVSKMCLVRKK